MKAQTRLFGEIDIAKDKIITLDKGMIGFPDLKKFALIFDDEKGADKTTIMWFQSMDDGDIAFPVMAPEIIKKDYKLTVSDEIFKSIGEMEQEDTYILVTVSVPKKVEDFSVNLKAPIIINTKLHKGVQVIVENDYPVKYKVYDLLKARQERAGDEEC